MKRLSRFFAVALVVMQVFTESTKAWGAPPLPIAPGAYCGTEGHIAGLWGEEEGEWAAMGRPYLECVELATQRCMNRVIEARGAFGALLPVCPETPIACRVGAQIGCIIDDLPMIRLTVPSVESVVKTALIAALLVGGLYFFASRPEAIVAVLAVGTVLFAANALQAAEPAAAPLQGQNAPPQTLGGELNALWSDAQAVGQQVSDALPSRENLNEAVSAVGDLASGAVSISNNLVNDILSGNW